MDLVAIALIVAWLLIVVFVGGGIFAYFAFAVPAMRSALPLGEGNRDVCRRIIKEHRGIRSCRHSVKKGACPCQPCVKLDSARQGKR